MGDSLFSSDLFGDSYDKPILLGETDVVVPGGGSSEGGPSGPGPVDTD